MKTKVKLSIDFGKILKRILGVIVLALPLFQMFRTMGSNVLGAVIDVMVVGFIIFVIWGYIELVAFLFK